MKLINLIGSDNTVDVYGLLTNCLGLFYVFWVCFSLKKKILKALR